MQELFQILIENNDNSVENNDNSSNIPVSDLRSESEAQVESRKDLMK